MWYKYRRWVTMLNKINISSKEQILIVYVVLAAITLAVFWQVNQYDFIKLDDNIYVTDNFRIKSGISLEGIRWAFSTTYAQFWHPLTWLSLMFDYQLFGLNAGGYHMTNLILHILSTLLLFWLFNRMTGALWKSAFVAALFALHPLHVESVAWISERKDVLSAFFWMLTLCLYVYYAEKPVIRRYLLVLFSFICALMSKPMVVTLPVVMILLDYWPLGRFELKKGNLILWQLKEKTPFFILSTVFSIITLYAQYKPSGKYFQYPSNSRLANALVSFVTYLEKTFWPHDMAVFYPFSAQIPLLPVIVASLLILVITTFVIVMVRRLPYLFIGWIWYVITIAPVIGIIKVGDFAMADRYHYLPSIGISIMLVWGISALIKSEATRKKFFPTAAIAFLVFLTVLSWKQCDYWKNDINLFNHALQVTKNNYVALNGFGLALVKAGKIKEAIDNYNEAISIKPNYPPSYISRGFAYFDLGQYQRAIEDCNEAIRLDADYAEPYFIRGNSYYNFGQYQRAIEDYNKAIRLKLDYTDAYYNRGVAYLKQGNKKQSCRDAQKTCELGNCKLLEMAKNKGDCH
jgi:protein O-mannosyl-transferase